MTDPLATCPNCSGTLPAAAAFCPACGQKVLTEADRRLGTLLRSAVEEITDLRGRVIASLLALLGRPGHLARAYREGRRKRYVMPVSLFLFANVMYFLMPSLSDFQITLLDQISLQPYSPWIIGLVEARLGSDVSALELWRTNDAGFTALESDYALRAGDLAKTVIVLHVPLLAAATALLAFDKRFYFADHVVLALHYMALMMLFYALIPNVLSPLVRLVTADGATALKVVRTFMLGYLLVYPTLMFRTAFAFSWWRAVVSAVIFAVAYQAAHLVFRLLQFFLVFYTM